MRKQRYTGAQKIKCTCDFRGSRSYHGHSMCFLALPEDLAGKEAVTVLLDSISDD